MEKIQYIKWKWCICSVLFVFQLLSLTPLLPSPCFEARTLCCAHKLVPTYSVRAFRFIFKLAICSILQLALCFSTQFAVHQRGRRASSTEPKSGESKQMVGFLERLLKEKRVNFFLNTRFRKRRWDRGKSLVRHVKDLISWGKGWFTRAAIGKKIIWKFQSISALENER